MNYVDCVIKLDVYPQKMHSCSKNIRGTVYDFFVLQVMQSNINWHTYYKFWKWLLKSNGLIKNSKRDEKYTLARTNKNMYVIKSWCKGKNFTTPSIRCFQQDSVGTTDHDYMLESLPKSIYWQLCQTIKHFGLFKEAYLWREDLLSDFA